jgi:hypothetical protein
MFILYEASIQELKEENAHNNRDANLIHTFREAFSMIKHGRNNGQIYCRSMSFYIFLKHNIKSLKKNCSNLCGNIQIKKNCTGLQGLL